jgi:transposase
VATIAKDGESAREAARLLNITASTAIRWIERWTRLGPSRQSLHPLHPLALKRHEQ